MLKNIETVLEKPILYKKTEGEFWNDEHISMQMLKAHLNPEFDGASRKHTFIEESVAYLRIKAFFCFFNRYLFKIFIFLYPLCKGSPFPRKTS